MKLTSHRKYWTVLALLLGSLVMSIMAQAGTISYSGFQFNDPVLQFASGSNDVKISGATINGNVGTYTLSAEFCQTGSCTGDSQTSDLLRLTNLSLTCAAEGTCDPIDISFQANGGSEVTSTTLDTWLTGGSFTGSQPSGYVAICIADGSHVCSAAASGSQSASFTFGSTLLGAVDYSFAISAPFTLVGDFHLDGLTNGSSVSLGNSLEIASITVAPEPGTILLLATGLAALLVFRRLRRRTAPSSRSL